MVDSTATSLNSSAMSRLLTIIEPLLQTASGKAVHQHISLLLENLQTTSQATQNAYTDLFRELLDILSSYAPPESPLQPHLQLLRLHLTSPLNASEVQQLRNTIRSIVQQSAQVPSLPHRNLIDHSLDALATSYDPLQAQSQTSISRAELQSETETFPEPSAIPASPARAKATTDQRVDHTYRRHLDNKRQRIQNIQKTLGEQVDAVIKQNEEFGVLLEVEYEALRHSDNITDLQNLRRILINEVEKLLKGNHELTSKLDKAKNYLKIIELEGQHLNDELTRVHILSLTDELTGLSNRRAFLRRLDDEVSRVQRYGSPLSLALIDMDLFKSINDKYGHPAGDKVLRTFSSNILSIFRHHDMVARYGGEEFAILLPNTDIDGSKRALEKVMARNAKSHFQVDGHSLSMPSFSAGLALYKSGETTSNLIERADKALFRAKEKGRNRIEISHGNSVEKQDIG